MSSVKVEADTNMRITGNSPEGQVALAHFAILIFAVVVYLTNFPVRPSEATQQQMIIWKTAGTVISVLIAPLCYLQYLIPTDDKLGVSQLVWIILVPVNSLLWSWGIVRLWRRMFRRPSQKSLEIQ